MNPSNSQQQPHQHNNPRQGIMRDDTYRQKAVSDHQRYATRRLAHQWACWMETRFKVPRWHQSRHTPRPRLSVCIITMNSAQRIAPLLTYLKSWLHPDDEIVVGVDSKTTDDTLAICQNIADTVFTIENTALTCNGMLGELVNHCTGDWVLRLDDDEFPEPHISDVLPALLNQQRVTHYKLPRLHISTWDTQRQQLWWVPDGYLYPDFQMRLFKNDPALLTFPEAVGHASIECAGQRGRLNTVNLVHLNHAINPRWRREHKLGNYIKRLDGSWVHPVNEYALLIEDFAYQCKLYTYPDADFLTTLATTITQQRQAYGDLPT